jgi:SET domain-containing protein
MKSARRLSEIYQKNQSIDMLLVRTKLMQSTIPGAGLGLFADQFIKKGTAVWRFCPGYDLIVSSDDLLRFSEESRAQFLNYCYFDKVTKHFILCGDDERFVNHSDQPNIVQSSEEGEIEGVALAGRDINKGEELFEDYYSFDEDADRKLKRLDLYSYLNYKERA